MRGLYAIADVAFLASRGIDLLAFARAVLAVQPAALQLRAKDVPAREVLGLLRALGPMCRQARVPLVANDRADLAALAGCGAVHIGQEDLPIELVQRIAPGLGVGISTHTPAQVERALAARPTYIAYGPVYPTGSKKNPDPVVGLEGLREASVAAARAGIPLVAIGGIDLSRATEVAKLAPCAAVIAAIVGESRDLGTVTEQARALHAALGGAPAAAHAAASAP